MNPIVIDTQNLSKQYKLGGHFQLDMNLPEIVEFKVKNLLRRLCGKKVEKRTDSRDFYALKNVSFTIRQGEVVGIIGHNGSGKSTLLKVLTQITDPSEGQARIAGRVASLLEVGTGFHPELSGRENIFLNGSIMGMTRKEIKEKFDKIVAYSGIERFLDTPVKRYSSGMSVRLAFSIAAHLEPEILVIDEVLAVGDAEFQKRCLGRMKNVASEGRTVLFVSHDMAAVQTLCSRVIMLENGKIVADGKPEEIIPLYANAIPQQNTDISHRSDRQGDGQATISRCQVTDLHGNDVRAGEPWQIQVDYQTHCPNAPHEFSFHINTIGTQKICNLSTNMLVNSPTHWPSKGTIMIHPDDDCRLWPESYTLTPTLHCNGNLSDRIQDAVRFNVIMGNQNRFKSLNNQHAVMMLPADIHIQDQNMSVPLDKAA